MINDRHIENRTAGMLKRAILPFSNPLAGTTETDTGWDLPPKVLVTDVILDVTTNAAGTLDVGTLTGETGADPNGLLDAESCAATGLVEHEVVNTTTGDITLGVLLYEAKVEDAGAEFHVMLTPYPSDALVAKSISYTPSAHVIAGNINIFYIDLA